MPTPHNVVVIAGSLRKESFTLKIAKALTKLAPGTLKLNVVTLHDISFFNQDLEAAPPADWLKFRETLQKSDGVIFVTPEYNRSIPGVLKNAIDNASRPYGQSAWAGKPGGVIGISVGAIGTALSQQHLRNVLAYLDMPTMGQPEAFVQNKEGLFDDKGHVTVEATSEFLKGWVEKYVEWVRAHGMQ